MGEGGGVRVGEGGRVNKRVVITLVQMSLLKEKHTCHQVD